MKKKGKKTKADEKEDAFERLYAILAANTPGLPALAPLPKEERPIISPTQVDKEKEKAEFDKLFAQLSSLSQRNKKNPPIISESSNIICTHEQVEDRTQHKIEHVQDDSKIEHVQDHSDENQFEEIYAQIVHIIAMKSQMQSAEHNTRTTRNKRNNTTHAKPKKEEILQCDACCKIFSTKGCFKRHQQTSSVCQSWLSLPAEQQYPVMDIPIHVKVNEYLEQAITGNESQQCRFCLTRFFNRGNHHKHYQTALICNRMAYVEFKRIVALSSNDLSDSHDVHT